MTRKYILIFSTLFLCLQLTGQSVVKVVEDSIKPYVLPELLRLENGVEIKNVTDWEQKRRPEILRLYKDHVYGNIPENNLIPVSVELLEESDTVFNNTAIRKQYAIVFKKNEKKLSIHILLYLPKKIQAPPVFVGYNFYGNHTTINDPNVILTSSWVRNNTSFGITENMATEASRGKRANRWPIQKIVNEGFGIAMVYYGDVDPDKNDFSDGIHSFFYDKNQLEPKVKEWGSISAWSWGISKVLDQLKAVHLLQDSKFILFGHSRLGKTSLWAGALDDRFDMVISNDSGCGGSALFNRKVGETISVINESFPHWFSNSFTKYNNKEETLPVDQHMLISLIAPRPVYIASAEEDYWSDPEGEHLAALNASPAYELYGKVGLTDTIFPNVNTAIHNTIGYHVRTGKHDVTEYDWEQFMLFARRHIDK